MLSFTLRNTLTLNLTAVISGLAEEIDRRYSKFVSWGKRWQNPIRGVQQLTPGHRILNDLNMSMIVARDVYASSRIATLDVMMTVTPLPLP